jgi:hypothetical protein
MKFCQADNCSNPVFSNGFCRNHQYKRENYDRRSITQRGIDRAVKEGKIKKPGWFRDPELEPCESDREPLVVPNVEKEYTVLWEWFKERRTEMTGKCQHCQGKTERDSGGRFHYSIAHLFCKAYYPSIATHPENWLELCYYNNSCHTNLDNSHLSLSDLNCFDEVVRKFCILYPLMKREEKRRVPPFLLQYLETEI